MNTFFFSRMQETCTTPKMFPVVLKVTAYQSVMRLEHAGILPGWCVNKSSSVSRLLTCLFLDYDLHAGPWLFFDINRSKNAYQSARPGLVSSDRKERCRKSGQIPALSGDGPHKNEALPLWTMKKERCIITMHLK